MSLANNTTKDLFDTKQVVAAVQLLVGNGNVTELRALEATTQGDNWPKTYSGYFDDPDKLAQAMSEIKSAKGIYIVPNQVDISLLARAANRLRKTPRGESTSDANISRRRWLLIDCDALRPTGISATDAEHQAALARVREISALLSEQGWPEPIVADSGNGGHLLYAIDLPAEDDKLVSRCLQALADRFDDEQVKVDQTVYNPARIWKLYGTLACKGDDTVERPHRMACVISAPESLVQVTLGELQALANEVPDSVSSANGHIRQDGFDIESFIKRNSLQVKGPSAWQGQQGRGQVWTLDDSPLCDHHNDGPHILRHASGAISAGCHHDSCDWTWPDLRSELEPNSPKRQSHNVPPPTATEGRFQPFPVASLPEPLKKFVREGARAIGCDASYIALPILSVVAAAIGNTRRLQLKNGWEAPAILWTAIIGESGSSKSPAFQLALSAIKARQQKSLQIYEEAVQKYKSEMVFYDRDMANWNKGKQLSEPPPEQPELPRAERFCVNDTTVEALAPILQANQRGLLLARDELAGWLGSFDKYSSGKGDASQWLSMHNGEGFIVDRKTGPQQTIHVPEAYVSITGGIQPRILSRALGTEHRESGLAARILLAFPPRREKRWTDDEIDPDLKDSIARLQDCLLKLEPHVDDHGNSSPVVAKLTREAKGLWETYYNEHAAEQVELSGDLSAAWSKLEEYAARISLVVHYVRKTAEDGSLEGSDLVDAKSMRSGITLANWFKREARRVYAMLGESEVEHDSRQLIEWIERRGGDTSVREVQQGHRQFRTAVEAETALADLVAAGHGDWHDIPTGPQGGRPTRIFRLFDLSTSTEPEESGGIESFVDVDVVGTNGLPLGGAMNDSIAPLLE